MFFRKKQEESCICPSCGTSVVDSASFCPVCGEDFSLFIETKRKAESGDLQAMEVLGSMYVLGAMFYPKDPAKGFPYLLKAAEGGSPSAQQNVGICYHNGEGTEKDLKKAAYWSRKAAEQGNAMAQLDLAGDYFNGEGVEKNPVRALYWLNKSAEQGNQNAILNLRNLGFSDMIFLDEDTLISFKQTKK